MIVYRRNIFRKLLSLRFSSLIIGAICFFFFYYHFDNLGYFTVVVLCTLAIIIIDDFIVSENSFSISKYYFFGFIKWTHLFNKGDKITASSYGSDFGEDGEIPDYDASSGVGCLVSIFYVFVPPKISMKDFKIRKFDDYNTSIKRIQILLNKSEYEHLKKFISKDLGG